ncbi:MAG: hypothetical protein DRR19_29805 [Candidatus Parabeggiatoa sp. nov. 1]|nr:MAG: hypothetical protein DRR19_29805 [Gammaproteobacteria bacterium]
MVRKIPKLIVGSVVICCFWGCGTTPKSNATPDVSSTSSAKTYAVLQEENRTLKQELANLQREKNPTKWIAKLELENTILKTELDRLEKQLNDLIVETGSESFGNRGDEENFSSEVTEKKYLKEQINKLKRKVEQRIRKLQELKPLIQAAN